MKAGLWGMSGQAKPPASCGTAGWWGTRASPPKGPCLPRLQPSHKRVSEAGSCITHLGALIIAQAGSGGTQARDSSTISSHCRVASCLHASARFQKIGQQAGGKLQGCGRRRGSEGAGGGPGACLSLERVLEISPAGHRALSDRRARLISRC